MPLQDLQGLTNISAFQPSGEPPNTPETSENQLFEKICYFKRFIVKAKWSVWFFLNEKVRQSRKFASNKGQWRSLLGFRPTVLHNRSNTQVLCCWARRSDEVISVRKRLKIKLGEEWDDDNLAQMTSSSSPSLSRYVSYNLKTGEDGQPCQCWTFCMCSTGGSSRAGWRRGWAVGPVGIPEQQVLTRPAPYDMDLSSPSRFRLNHLLND